MPNSWQKSLVKPFEPSSCAAARLGPNAAMPAAARSSTTPATSGASGPTMTNSMSCARQASITAPGSAIESASKVATASQPGIARARRTVGSSSGDRRDRRGDRVFARAGSQNQNIHRAVSASARQDLARRGAVLSASSSSVEVRLSQSASPPFPSAREPSGARGLFFAAALDLAPTLAALACAAYLRAASGRRHARARERHEWKIAERWATAACCAARCRRRGARGLLRPRSHLPQIDDLQAADAERQARGLWRRRPARRGRRLPLHRAGKGRPDGRARARRADVGHFAGLPAIRADQVQRAMRARATSCFPSAARCSSRRCRSCAAATPSATFWST